MRRLKSGTAASWLAVIVGANPLTTSRNATPRLVPMVRPVTTTDGGVGVNDASNAMVRSVGGGSLFPTSPMRNCPPRVSFTEGAPVAPAVISMSIPKRRMSRASMPNAFG